jgi:hypothetical protein
VALSITFLAIPLGASGKLEKVVELMIFLRERVVRFKNKVFE